VKVSELEYDLPPELVAQRPAARRDGSRLFVYDRGTGERRHRVFRDLPDELHLVVGVAREAVDRDDGVQTELAHDLQVADQVPQGSSPWERTPGERRSGRARESFCLPFSPILGDRCWLA